MRHKRIQNLIVGGALMGALLISLNAYGYDNLTTHPALTGEIVNFYNLNFPEKLNEQDKKWLIQGSIDEDAGIRSMNHFYDPVYNRGMAGFPTSKQWALVPADQTAWASLYLPVTALPAKLDENSLKPDGDWSYPNALSDYARGNRERAMIGFGHVLHLLEDVSVPEHTRNDPHPPIGNFGSPYEHEMTKWTPDNFKIAGKLKQEGDKPVILNSVGDYFDNIAKYSNGYFFSKGTINTTEYENPKILKASDSGYTDSQGGHIFYGTGKDKDGSDLNLVALKIKFLNKSPEIYNESLILDVGNQNLKSVILDGYWDRLSKDEVLNGAGALKLFLSEAEKAKKEYEAVKPQENQKSWLAKLLGTIGIVINSPQTVTDIGDTTVSPIPTPKETLVSLTPLVTETPKIGDTPATPIPSPTLSPTPSPSITPIPTTTAKPSPTPAPKYSYSSGGGGSASAPTPTPTPTSTPTSTPNPTPSPTPTLTPSATPTPSPETESSTSALGRVVINEIAWMGTATSSNDEWMELYNTTNQPINIDGWTLKSLTGTNPDPNIALSGTIPAFGFYLLERTNDKPVSDITADKIYTGALLDTGEVLQLRDGGNNLQDKISNTGGWYAGDKTTKSSMERINPRQSGDNSANWATNNGLIKNGHDAAGNPINGTPRRQNSVYVSLKPSAVTDIAVTGADGNFGNVLLTWSAPEDLDTLSANLSYDLRYATQSFSLADTWDEANKIPSSSLPAVGEKGASESASFDIGHIYVKKYYFALKTENPADQTDTSDISNVAENQTESALTDTWQMWGDNPYHTAFADLKGPAKNATISWEFDAGFGYGVGQPVVSNKDNIYFGSSNNLTPKLYSIDKNGSENWHYNTPGKPSNLAVLSDGATYFGQLSPAGIMALNSDGTKRWGYDGVDRVDGVTISGNGNSYFSSQNNKFTVLKPDGSVKWQSANSSVFDFSPIVLENGNIITAARLSGTPHFYAYSENGDLLWEHHFTDGFGFLPSDVSYDVDTHKTYSAVGPYLLEFTETGEATKKTIDFNGKSVTAVSISPDDLVLGMDFSWLNPASGSEILALDKTTEETKWTFKITGNSKINNPIAVDQDENIYFSTQDGKIYSLDKDGNLNWTIDVGAVSEVSPILREKAVIWGYDSKIVEIQAK